MKSRKEIERIHNEMVANDARIREALAQGDAAYEEFKRKREVKTRAEQDELLRLALGQQKTAEEEKIADQTNSSPAVE